MTWEGCLWEGNPWTSLAWGHFGSRVWFWNPHPPSPNSKGEGSTCLTQPEWDTSKVILASWVSHTHGQRLQKSASGSTAHFYCCSQGLKELFCQFISFLVFFYGLTIIAVPDILKLISIDSIGILTVFILMWILYGCFSKNGGTPINHPFQ